MNREIAREKGTARENTVRMVSIARDRGFKNSRAGSEVRQARMPLWT